MEAVATACADGRIPATVAIVVADRACGAVARARGMGLRATVIDRRQHGAGLSAAIAAELEAAGPDLVLLAGFLSILTDPVIERWSGSIVNIHPSLLPRHGGAGMYGIHVHRAVLAAGDAESGCTVHYVDAGTDTGAVIAQARCRVHPTDTPETLATRVQAAEKRLLISTLADLLSGSRAHQANHGAARD